MRGVHTASCGTMAPKALGARGHRQGQLGGQGQEHGSSHTWAQAHAPSCVILSKFPNVSVPRFSIIVDTGDAAALRKAPGLGTRCMSFELVARAWGCDLASKGQPGPQERALRGEAVWLLLSSRTGWGDLRQGRGSHSAPWGAWGCVCRMGPSGPLAPLPPWGLRPCTRG